MREAHELAQRDLCASHLCKEQRSGRVNPNKDSWLRAVSAV